MRLDKSLFAESAFRAAILTVWPSRRHEESDMAESGARPWSLSVLRTTHGQDLSLARFSKHVRLRRSSVAVRVKPPTSRSSSCIKNTENWSVCFHYIQIPRADIQCASKHLMDASSNQSTLSLRRVPLVCPTDAKSYNVLHASHENTSLYTRTAISLDGSAGLVLGERRLKISSQQIFKAVQIWQHTNRRYGLTMRNSGKSVFASSFLTDGCTMTSSPGTQLMGVVMRCLSPVWSESRTRRTSAVLRPVEAGYERIKRMVFLGSMMKT